MFLLDKLWAGDISPAEDGFLPNREYTEAIETMDRCDDIMKTHLPESDYRLFREYAEAALSSSCIETQHYFIEGFRMGARMMIDVLMDIGQD